MTTDGRRVEAVAWDHNCMEDVCGSCAMSINRVPRPSCSALVDDLEQSIVLEPRPKFPVERHLLVDRSRMDTGRLQRAMAWIELDGTWDIQDGAPRIPPAE
ncbi:2Fe-2S iron-sulfur cluster-binding protein [Thiorhodococcus fuscus]|uniref:succinate dehydrogenase n=1 Tax=Thiorhodococcus fuscus TaxID=527200 RepID=A0ABW4YEV4_9GAMM